MFIEVEHFTGWPIGRATRNATSTLVTEFFKEDDNTQFGAPRRVVSDNASCFTSAVIKSFMLMQVITANNVRDHPHMSNGKVESTVGTMKRWVAKMALNGPSDWEEALRTAVYGYGT